MARTQAQVPGLPLDARSQFLREANAIVPLTESEEALLLTALSSGDSAARTRLIEAYQLFVYGLAKHFATRCTQLDVLDLVQEGNLGLLEAVDKQANRAAASSFRLWVYTWVKELMRQAIVRYESAIRLPRLKARELRRLAHAQLDLLATLGREATVGELSIHLSMPETAVRDLLLLQARQVLSLDGKSGDNGASLEVHLSGLAPARAIHQYSLTEWIAEAVELLPAREQAIIRLLYGFDDGASRTSREVALVLGITPTAVQLLDRRVRRRLAGALRASGMVRRDSASVA